MELNTLAKQIHENAVNHGWWESKREFPEVVALIHNAENENGLQHCASVPARGKESMKLGCFLRGHKLEMLAYQNADIIVKECSRCHQWVAWPTINWCFRQEVQASEIMRPLAEKMVRDMLGKEGENAYEAKD